MSKRAKGATGPVIVAWLKRILPSLPCGHDWEWTPEVLQFGDADYQRGICRKCGRITQREIGWSARRDKYGEDGERERLRAYIRKISQ